MARKRVASPLRSGWCCLAGRVSTPLADGSCCCWTYAERRVGVRAEAPPRHSSPEAVDEGAGAQHRCLSAVAIRELAAVGA